MHKMIVVLSIVMCLLVKLTVLGWLLIPVPTGVTLYMYQDKPAIAEKVAKQLRNAEITKYIHQSTQYVYTYPQADPWEEFVYVIRGKASRITLFHIDAKYRIFCYNLAIKINPQISIKEQALLWSEIS